LDNETRVKTEIWQRIVNMENRHYKAL